MTNKERQKSLDKQKWVNSEDFGYDLSGKLFYCDHCKYQTERNMVKSCIASQKQREEKSLCATAYNKMVRGGNK